MATNIRATLGGTNLPEHFSYRPYIPRKRNSVTPTAGAVIVQAAGPNQIVHGDGVLPWTCEKCYPSEFQQFWDWYNTPGLLLYEFVGYWGETLQVYFTTFDEPTVRSRLFDCSGQFQVICVDVEYNATCGG